MAMSGSEIMNELTRRQYMDQRMAQQQAFGGLNQALGSGALANAFAQYATSGTVSAPAPEPKINRKLLLLGDVQ